MTWLVLRLHRQALLLTAALVGTVVVLLGAGRLLTVDALLTGGLAQDCFADPTRDCQRQAMSITREQAGADGLSILGTFWGFGHLTVLLLPLVLGLLAGAGLFSRELDQGTHLLTLTQNVSRSRWAVLQLGVAASTAVLGALVVSAVAGWAFTPMAALVMVQPSIASPVMETSGIAPAGYALLAVAVAAIAGLLTRSAPVAAIVATVVYATAVIVVTVVLRPGYLPAVTDRTAVPVDPEPAWSAVDERVNWVLELRHLDRSDREVPGSAIEDAYLDGRCASATDATCLPLLGIVTVESDYHPQSRYWTFQLVETTILALLAAAATGVGAVRLRRSLVP